MKERIILLFILVFGLMSVYDGYSLQTYVGIKILNLTDEPGSSCANEPGYGPNGRIRALSSILPDYPIYFEVTKVSDSTLIWAGNSTQDCLGDGSGCDYIIGDTILLPQLMDLESGEQYNIFFDIDAIRIYLPLVNSGGFVATDDDNYWTIWMIGSGNYDEYSQYSSIGGCSYANTITTQEQYKMHFVSNNRNSSIFTNNCISDTINHNCNGLGLMGIYVTISGYDYNVKGKYNDLHTPTVGNFNFNFNMP